MIAIIDYQAGNAPSVLHAVKHLGHAACLAHDSSEIAGATHVILPGVGSAGATMRSLHAMGLIKVLAEAVLRGNTKFLGICVGMQILFDHSAEEDVACLGWLEGRVVKFDAAKTRVPQMGWNMVRFSQQAPFQALDDFYYFVNSYYAQPAQAADIWGVAAYGDPFAAAVCRGNIFATQFHVEKSGPAGLALLDGFLGGPTQR